MLDLWDGGSLHDILKTDALSPTDRFAIARDVAVHKYIVPYVHTLRCMPVDIDICEEMRHAEFCALVSSCTCALMRARDCTCA